MALRNAFEKLLTETVAGAVEAVLTKMDARAERQSIMEQPRALQYARNINDAMYVQTTNAQQAYIYAGNTSLSLNQAGHAPIYGNYNATFMVDERWQQGEQALQTFNQVRTNRWVFS